MVVTEKSMQQNSAVFLKTLHYPETSKPTFCTSLTSHEQLLATLDLTENSNAAPADKDDGLGDARAVMKMENGKAPR